VSVAAAIPAPASWARRNLWLAGLFGPLLVLTGVAGLLLPARLSLMSNAVPYDGFHIAFGMLGIALVVARSARGAALFNAGFGAIDLYQALAGVTGVFPARLFQLKPADHVVHVLFGAVLVVVGVRYWLSPRS
jgi:hypothetical protein